MHILIAGATGAAGRALIPLLIANGHTVTGTTRSEAKAGELRALGANAQIMDGLDAASVKAAIDATQPDVIVHQMTALTGIDMKNIDKAFRSPTGCGRRAPSTSSPRRRASWWSRSPSPAGRTPAPAGRIKTEADPLDPTPPKGIRETHAAIRRLEASSTQAGGIVLRYGGFYGPGSGMAQDGGEQVEMIRKRQFPLVGNGEGIWSFLHTDDLATATLAAIERGRPGEIYNIVDDEPAADQGVAALPGRDDRRQASAQGPGVAGEDRRQPGRGGDDDRVPGRVQRQGEGRTGLAADPPELAPGLPRRRLRRAPKTKVQSRK